MKTHILNVPRHVPPHWYGMPPITQQIAAAMSGDTLDQRYAKRTETARAEQIPESQIAGIMANNDEQRRIADEKVLSVLRERGPMTRGDLKKISGISSSNVCIRVRRLISAGKIVEGDGYPSLVWAAEDHAAA